MNSAAEEHIDKLNELCEKHGCEPGSNRLEWLDAQLSMVPRPAEKTFDVWAAVGADKELDRARSRISMHEFRLIFRHAWANPPSPVADKEKLQALIDKHWPKDEPL